MRLSIAAVGAGVELKKVQAEIDRVVARQTHDAYHSSYLRKAILTKNTEEERLAAVAALSST